MIPPSLRYFVLAVFAQLLVKVSGHAGACNYLSFPHCFLTGI